MKNYLADSNIFVRIFVGDNHEQKEQALDYLNQAKNGKIKITVLSEIIPEVEYVLRKVYKINKKIIVGYLQGLVKDKFISVEKRDLWIDSLDIYFKNNVDLIDAYLYANKLKKNINIISFDKDFKKIK